MLQFEVHAPHFPNSKSKLGNKGGKPELHLSPNGAILETIQNIFKKLKTLGMRVF